MDISNDILKAYIAQMESAVKISAVLSDHNSDSNELTGDDIICGLVYRLMVPMTDAEMKDSLEEADKVMDEDSSDEEEYDDIAERYDKPLIHRKVNTNSCECDICSNVRVCLMKFKDHEPNDPMAQIFKDSITETCGVHKIYI